MQRTGTISIRGGFFCANVCKAGSFSNQRCLSTKTGTVKFYNREKGYGFITADDNPNVDVFVHYSRIECSPPLPADFRAARWPYLRKSERVRFESGAFEDGREQAAKVTWANGNPIPPERTNYLGNVHERSKRLLGEIVFDLLEKANHSDAELLTEIRAQYDAASTEIQNAETFVRKLGMDPSQFPTARSATGRGRYIFPQDHQEDSSNENDSTTDATGEEESSLK